MAKTSWQAKRDLERKKQKQRTFLLYGGLGLAALLVFAGIFFVATRPAAAGGLMGEAVPVTSREHVADNTNPGPYNSNPPAGGPHYAVNYTERFYEESDLPGLGQYPEGHLVHSLEHGYVIFWYNCQVSGVDCAALKQTIRQVMDDSGGTKLIAFPWASLDVPLALTSWGRVLKFDAADPAKMKEFVQRNRYKAPEPDAR